MADIADSFVSAGSDPQLASLAGDGRPAFLFDRTGTRLAWTNGAGAAWLGARSAAEIAARRFAPDHPTTRRIAALSGQLSAGQARTERLALPKGLIPQPVVCRASRVILGAERLVLLVVADGTGRVADADAAERYARLARAAAAPAPSHAGPVRIAAEPMPQAPASAEPTGAADRGPASAAETGTPADRDIAELVESTLAEAAHEAAAALYAAELASDVDRVLSASGIVAESLADAEQPDDDELVRPADGEFTGPQPVAAEVSSRDGAAEADDEVPAWATSEAAGADEAGGPAEAGAAVTDGTDGVAFDAGLDAADQDAGTTAFAAALEPSGPADGATREPTRPDLDDGAVGTADAAVRDPVRAAVEPPDAPAPGADVAPAVAEADAARPTDGAAAEAPAILAAGSGSPAAPDAAPDRPGGVEAFSPPTHGRTVRFVFELDGDLRFGFVSDDLAAAVGPAAADVVGRNWTSVASDYALDPLGRVDAALRRRDTFTGLTVDWPVQDAAARMPVDLAGMPVFGRDRTFRGYRGFGIAKTGAIFAAPMIIPPAPDCEADELADAMTDIFETAGGAAATAALAAGIDRPTADSAGSGSGAPDGAAEADDLAGDLAVADAPALVDDVVPVVISDAEVAEPAAAAEDLGTDWAAEDRNADEAAAEAPAVPSGMAAPVVQDQSEPEFADVATAEAPALVEDIEPVVIRDEAPGPEADSAASEAEAGLPLDGWDLTDDEARDDLRALDGVPDEVAGDEPPGSKGEPAAIEPEVDASPESGGSGKPDDILPETASPTGEPTELSADIAGDLIPEDATAAPEVQVSEAPEPSLSADEGDPRETPAAPQPPMPETEPAPAEQPEQPATPQEAPEEPGVPAEPGPEYPAPSPEPAPEKAPSEAPGDLPPEIPLERPDEAPADRPSEEPAGIPAEEPAGMPSEVPGPGSMPSEFAADAGPAGAPAFESRDATAPDAAATATADSGERPVPEVPTGDGPDAPQSVEPTGDGPDAPQSAEPTGDGPDAPQSAEPTGDGPDAPQSAEPTTGSPDGAAPETAALASVPDDDFEEAGWPSGAHLDLRGREATAVAPDLGPGGADDLFGGPADDNDVAWREPSPQSAEVIPSPIVPRSVPKTEYSAEEADRRQLSRPEREAFQKIAEALGARLEGAPAPAEGFELGGMRFERSAPAAHEVEADDASDDAADFARSVPAPAAGFAFDAALLDKVPVPLAILKDGEAVSVNRAFLDLTGYPDLTALQAAGGFAEAFAGSALPRDASLPAIRRRDGIEVPVNARLHSIPFGDGVASLMVVQDVAAATGRDRAAAAEQRVEELEAILDTATDGVLVLDPKGTVVGANRSAEALFGTERAAMIGEPLVNLLAPESHRSALDYLDGLNRNGLSSLLNDGREVIGRVKQGGLVPLFMTVGRIASGRFCAVLRDITQWKRAEEELTAAKRSAETASSQKSDFLAKISHEIRTPLNAIIGFSEVMMEERFGPVGSERYKEYLRDIHISGAHIMSLVNDLLDLSKIEAGKLDLSFEAVSVNDVIRECVALMQPQANRERIIIRTSLSSSLPAVVADNRSLRQIVLNLLSNAIKFNNPGGQVIVSTLYEDTGEVAIRVRDTGPGMSEDDIAKALEPFRQLHTARPGRGTGLGLPLTKALVEANRAGFRIDSAVGQGTLVQITFPSTRVLAE